MPADTPQLDLLGGDPARPAEVHNLFFALLADDDVRVRIARVADALKADGRLRGQWVKPANYHVTLHFLGGHADLRPAMVDAASQAAAGVRCAPFELVLDRLTGFRGRRPPCVLGCLDTPAGLAALWEALRDRLIRHGLGGGLSRSFTPHATLAYADRLLDAPPPFAPVHWPVRDFALVHNKVGSGAYRVLGRWPLTAGP
ncbi:hypothetical protein ASG87_03420 [Frateuria sp. Soil773]|uniref:2'-5' RNA ligase family protein n=1 Tax=Frateuria sp. Soil773 TaxID=1736407 RepID=UPI0007010967|nr:2'-5' RNA ligase family protein [Frateuria sp. Soil773]KRE89403.1 hypothetical protein ASG87_03420 [Frateuria sp. Soil773]